jgi:catechol 2,3-dioxygenase-like lactoylglutathione lyase family enzyme
MKSSLHHVHAFASDVEASIRFYTEVFDGQVVFDDTAAGARNVFIRLGSGRLHLYDQPPRHAGSGSVHHIGIQTDDIQGVLGRLAGRGVVPRKPVAEFGFWRYVMVEALDGLLIELFEVTPEAIPERLRGYF